ncbi:MAG: AAA family ATPase [Magnetococcales bacterium]|nr:AAA family ATPase [Magnetococcales bacterium]
MWLLEASKTDDGSDSTQWFMNLPNPLDLPSAQGFPDINFVAEPWFPEAISSGRSKEGFNLTLGAPYTKYWPRYITKDKKWQIHTPTLVPPQDAEQLKEWEDRWAAFCVSVTATRIILNLTYRDNEQDSILEKSKFAKYDAYIPKRAIELKPDKVMADLKENHGIQMPWYVIEAACSSLNANKNVIFTGPPGCGKTALAMHLAKVAGFDYPIAVTASPVWSTNELIGRYMPSIGDSKPGSLTFRPGFFLRAILEGTWLIIDELNRADIDACFGELFTVLSGQPSILPFEELVAVEGNEKDDSRVKQIVILPQGIDISKGYSDYQIYSINKTFRIIGTMNDADASRLHQLSYAFQRRFNIIRVEAPGPEIVKEIIEKTFEKASKSLEDSNTRYFFGGIQRNLTNKIYDYLTLLFANSKDTKNLTKDLVQLRIVGVAQVIDIIDLLCEGLSSPDRNTKISIHGSNSNNIPKEFVEHVIYSYIAIGVTMSVFPQLMAFTSPSEHSTLAKALTIIQDTFKDKKFYRITKGDQGGEGNKEATYCLVNSKGQTTLKEEHNDIFTDFLKIELENLLKPVGLTVDSILINKQGNGV